MTLLEIRKQFIKLSGRFDLVVDTEDYIDNGADFYITGGQQLLDRLIEPKPEIVEVDLTVGEYLVDLERSTRVITTVFAVDTVGNVVKLLPRSMDTLQELYGEEFSQVDNAAPIYWADNIGEEATIVRTLIVLPPVAAATTIRVVGHFMTVTLASDEDENFWSLHYPHLLINSALWRLEVSYRNTEGAKDWLSAIQAEIVLVDMDIVANEVANVNQMEG